MWRSNDTFLYVLKAEFVTLISLKVPSGLGMLNAPQTCTFVNSFGWALKKLQTLSQEPKEEQEEEQQQHVAVNDLSASPQV